MGLAHVTGSGGVETRTLELGQDIFKKSRGFFNGRLGKGFLNDIMMEWSMRHHDFKIEMFRFVDVLPSLVHSSQIIRHLKEYFLSTQSEVPFWVRSGLGVVTRLPLTNDLTARLIRKNVSSMARTFITGENAECAAPSLESIWKNGFGFTVDILGEAAVAESEATHYQKLYLDLVRHLPEQLKSWPVQPILESSAWGKIPRANVSVKLSSLFSQIDPLNFRACVETLKSRLRPILAQAVKNGVFVNIDMEQNDFRELFFAVAEEIFAEDEFRNYPHFGVVVQAYLKSAQEDLRRLIHYCKGRGTPVTIRLVKGAYWDYEIIRARQNGWPIPVFINKAETDANYEACTDLLLEAYPHIAGAFGSHNVRSISHAMARAEELGLARNAIEIQMLYGMATPFKRAVADLGYRVRDYAPVGEMLPGMAYLVRRLLENTSNEGFLKVKYMKPNEALNMLKKPVLPQNADVPFSTTGNMQQTGNGTTLSGFVNEPLLDFSGDENRRSLIPAFKALRQKLPLSVDPLIDGQAVEGTPVSQSVNPCNTHEVITRFSMAHQYHADQALAACHRAKKTWSSFAAEERARVIRKVADVLLSQRDELIAVIVLETGKTVREADGDVCEAIDFCRYYADEYLALAKPKLTAEVSGETNHYLYRPRGVAVAIAPWNFPLAILTGMTVGPLVCGNPVIMKPAEQSTGVSVYLYRALLEAGVPAEAVHLLPGAGEVIGQYLVNHSQVHIITFTGSKAVGLNILRGAYHPLPGQKHIKKVVAELGGKNGIIIDDDADLDEAVVGALHSVFGFQGQKCSACSRIIVHESCYDKFKKRFVDAMMSLKIGHAENPDTRLAAVIDAASRDRLMEVIHHHRDEIVAQLELPQNLAASGYFVPPTVFESDDPKSELGQKEFFGPLVTLFKVQNFDEALAVLNGVDYALTGGLYSRSPSHIDRARREMEAGNLYVNRGITGALVARQPFGGYKLSGVGGKAGGPDYLLQFVEPITITENTMRRGFSPDM